MRLYTFDFTVVTSEKDRKARENTKLFDIEKKKF